MKKLVMSAAVLAVLGMLSSVAMAKNQSVVETGGVYSLTKSCPKGKVRRAGRRNCVACPKGTHANRKQTKCYWNKKVMRGSHVAPKKAIPHGSY